MELHKSADRGFYIANSHKLIYILHCSLIALFFLTSCATSQRDEKGYYKVGEPYKIQNQWYYPKVEHDYDEIGVASWYGSEFHNKETANGGVFNKNSFTAAHRTLPLPSMVKVTNLANNKSMVVMVNDRGPFSKNRIIDVSEKVAEKLGFKDKGTAKVRVQFLREETRKLLANVPGAEKADEIKLASSSKTEDNATTKPYTDYKAKDREIKSSSLPSLISSANAAEMPLDSQNIFIQAGIFSVVDNAKNMEKKLSSISNVSIVPTTTNGRSMYKVKIGPFNSTVSANEILKQVKVLGATDAIIIKK